MNKPFVISFCAFSIFLSGLAFASEPCFREGLVIAQYNLKPEYSLGNQMLTGYGYNHQFFLNLTAKDADTILYVFYGDMMIYSVPVNSSYFGHEQDTSRYSTSMWPVFDNLSKINGNLTSFNNSRLDLRLGNADIGNLVLKYDKGSCGQADSSIGMTPFLILLYIFAVYVLPFLVLFLVVFIVLRHFRRRRKPAQQSP